MSKFCMGCMNQFSEEHKICPHCGYIENTKVEEALHMEPGSILRDRYIVGRALGFGGFGVTYIGWDAILEQKIAIKEYLPSEFSTRVPGQTQITVFSGDKSEQFGDGLTKFVDEAQRLAKFHHEDGVVRIFDSFEANNTAYIIMELLQGETLAEYLKREPKMAADRAISMLMPVIRSLQTINERGIIHRDIAPDNIFLTHDGKVKLIDFGAARFATTSHSRSMTVIIKPGYSPEEQYRSRGDQGSYTDVYAIGATLYRMVTGITPPDALERRAHFESNKKDILKPISKFTRDITENQETAIYNSLNVRIEDRTQNMATLAKELTTTEPEKVERLYGKIKKIDVLKWPLWAKIGAPAALFAVVVLSTLFALGMIGFDAGLQREIVIPDGMSRVPSIINNDIEQAGERLNAVILLYSIVGRDYSEQIPTNRVLTQNINAGLVVINNTIIEITISGGAETKVIPDVSGLSIEDAKSLLEELGFAILIVNEYSNIFAAGAVISQDIEADSNLVVGSTITLVVSKGVNPAEVGEQWLSAVPALVGMELEDALEAAQQAGFVVSIRSREYSIQFDRNVVMFQDLEPGTEIMSGNTIELIVSLGIQIIRVPEVQFRTETEAIRHITNAGLTAGITRANSETVASGLVISQNPVAGTVMEHGDVVSIVISAGGESFAMPNVVGMTVASASSTLSGRGISVSVEYERNANVAEGNVIRQSIASGASVSLGTRVTITVSSGENLVQVANVAGRPQAEATNTLRGQGFNVTVNEAASATVAQGNVISQTPAAASSQISGTQVIITVSTGRPTVDVPNVVGRTQSAAETSLRNAGFVVSTTNAASTTVPSGSVISQTPASGTATSGSTVALVISTGPESIQVANVVGQSRANAESTLRGQGFTVTVVEAVHATVARGNVISQNPVAGISRVSGYTVTITVSRGADTVTNIAVRTNPTRTNYNVGDTLNTAGLSLNVTWAGGETTTVTDGFTVSPTVLNTQGTQTITVTFAGRTTTFTVTVQDSVDRISVRTNPTRTTFNVGDTLNTAGLSLNVYWTSGRTTTINSGFTVSPTTLTTAGMQTITVTYREQTATFPVTVANIPVPNVVGMTRANAENAIRNAGFTPVVTEEYHATVAQGNVISQNPAAGATPNSGATVTVAVSRGAQAVAPTITTTSLPNATVGVAYSQQIEMTGTAPITWSINHQLAFGLVFDDSVRRFGTGRIYGTPTAPGTSTFTITARNSAGSYSRTFTLRVDPETSPVPNVVGMTRANAENAIQNAGLVVGTVTAQYHDTITRGQVISQTPQANTAVNRGSTVNIVVSSGGTPYTITTTSLPNATVGVHYDTILAGTGPTTIRLWSIWDSPLPLGLEIDSGTGRIYGTPTTAGTFTFTVRMHGQGTGWVASRELSIVINPAPIVEVERLSWQRTQSSDFLITSPAPGANQAFTVRQGDNLTISVTTNIPTNYPSSRYVLWGAFMPRWDNERSVFINRGNITTDFVIDTSGMDVGTHNFSFAIFHPDRFATGQSLHDSRIRIVITE